MNRPPSPNTEETLSLSQRVDSFNAKLEEGVSAFESGETAAYHSAVESTGKELQQLCELGRPDLALKLEPRWYQYLVKKIESDEHYAKCFRHHYKSLWSCGVAMSPGPIISGAPDSIAFVAMHSVLLGHTEVMLLIMADWKRHHPELRAMFVGLSPCKPDLAGRLEALGIQVVTPDQSLPPLMAAKWLRKTLIQENVGTAIWLSLPIWAPFIFGYGIARKQIFWSLKFHAVHLGPSVVHIGMTKTRSGTTEIHGQPWQGFQPPLAVSVITRDLKKRNKLRGEFDDKFLFTTLAREEKFHSDSFAFAIAHILKRCPRSVFLFSGKSVSPVLKRTLTQHGVMSQAHFVGWVNTELYANLADCFLESFPFGCGVTGMQAISHGTPVVSLWAEDTLPTFYFEDARQAAKFHSNWKVTSEINEYIDAATNCYKSWLTGIPRTTVAKTAIDSLDRDRYKRFYELVVAK